MAVDFRFILTGAKRVFDSRPIYAQMVVTDDCNLSCAYCYEHHAGAPLVPLHELEKRVDKLDALGVQVYDFLGGEPLKHPEIAALIQHTKSKRGGSNVVTIITNGFLLQRELVRELNEARLDFMQVSIDSVAPTESSKKTLKSVLSKLEILAAEARFKIEIQTVLNDDTCATYDALRRTLQRFPFAFGFSIMHDRDGRIAIHGEKFLGVLRKHGVFDGTNVYGKHLRELLYGNFTRRWKCLSGFKFLYVNSSGSVQWCSQQPRYVYPLELMDIDELRQNNRHKPCEAGCSLGCARLVSHMLGEPLRTLRASLTVATRMGLKR